ncbi:hypothetical protein ECANGB1_240 [Enterospora canceri]|uniref:Uncharacterized protein n=1 Tax=Enterospora canceri TaxID=1081671 RepID=A0A1Y1S862_9MICR|nr:hypothetical protein ECANGB1_240 [Enterospora canceri]
MAEQDNSEEKQGIFSTAKSHIISVITLNPIDLAQKPINLTHYLLVVVLYSIAIFTSYLITLLIKLKLLKAVTHILLPTYPLIGCFTIIALSFMGGYIYSIFLNNHSLKNYYLVLLASGYLPFVMILSTLIKDLAIVFYICAGIASDYFLRRSLMYGKSFERRLDRIYFVTISMLMNVGAYWAIFPIFFM